MKIKHRIMWLFTFILLSLLLPQWSAAQNNALSFDGTDDYVELGTLAASNPDFSQAVSLTLWVKFNALAESEGMFDIGDNDGIRFFQFTYGGQTSLGYQAWSPVTGGSSVSLSSTQMVTGRWYHFAFTEGNGYVKMYLDGMLVATNPTYSMPNNINRTGNVLGAYYDYIKNLTKYYFNGVLDEVSLWNRELSQTEVYNCIKSGFTGSESGLALYYQFNQGTANGTNTSVQTLTSKVSSPNISGTLRNFTLSGTSSNWVSGYTSQVVYSITPSTDTISLGRALNSKAKIDIVSNTKWTVTESSSWLSLDKTSGSFSDSITITATAVNSSNTSRSATITLSSTDVSQPVTVVVTQDPVSLTLSSGLDTLDAGQNSTSTVDIVNDGDTWMVVESSDWLSVSPTSGSTDATLTLTAITTNETEADRSAEVIVKGTISGDDTIVVTQLRPTITLSQNSFRFISPTTSGSVGITTPVAWTATGNASWLTLSSSEGTGNTTINFTAESLPEGTAFRSGEIVFTGAFISDTLHFFQYNETDNALSFDGSDDHIIFDDITASNADFLNGITYSAWVKFDELQYNKYLVYLFPSGTNSYKALYLSGYGNGLHLESYYKSFTINNVLSANVWTHIAFTIKSLGITDSYGIHGTGTIYVNGEEVGSGTVYMPVSSTYDNFTVGNRISDNLITSPYCSMDEIGLWDRVLTQSEIVELMRNGITGSEPDIVTYYNFKQGYSKSDNKDIDVLYSQAASPSINGELFNFALSGTSSNWVDNYDVSEAACKLTLSDSVLSVESIPGNSKKFAVKSNAAWSISPSESWYTLDSYSGYGNDSITVTAAELNLLADESDTLTVSVNGVNKNLVLSQTYPTIQLSADTLWVCDTEHKDSFTINTNISNWTVT
ncbi:MAG TPA: BACON domain-containing carbohydrate-binding protein, partial [Paludibacteraceae bacterium]|nr:BACON domain-containing carbohydrate-binding protein [Paludibacteraceae bacterium]